ncbi:hypothetical protein D9757_009714 [Collybiopsis confluens]|uniref:RNA exonuclease 4 n=1 Tax=Collybiopsis confluens TaxID=2823264 RepID=A0A8H5H643_9AGAR|nr:hypothetical protein D9757_009714 [Collybiopsis confluens]
MSKTPTKTKTGSSLNIASSNWLALQKKITTTTKRSSLDVEDSSRKRRKISHDSQYQRDAKVSTGLRPRGAEDPSLTVASQSFAADTMKNGESLSALRKMVLGEEDGEVADDLKQPGKYLAIDCEMVGIGIDGSESSLARVSIVDYYGATMMDAYVRQRERVVDYRTQWSGIREKDMVGAKPFKDVQKRVAELIKDRILVGHAVHNDLKALLLSHPWPLTRDTQYFAGKHKVVKSKYVALRNLVKQELDITIQGGEHSSLTDARATMAVYRIYRKEWETGSVSSLTASLMARTQPKQKLNKESGNPDIDSEAVAGIDENEGRNQGQRQKRKRVREVESDADMVDIDTDDEVELEGGGESKARAKPQAKLSFPGGGRKGISSGMTTVITRRGKGGGDRESGSRKGGGGVGPNRNGFNPKPKPKLTSKSSSSSGQGQWWTKV